ncbi:MAG: sodium/proton-translocating pyrophosphatase, partial [Ferruginibacter sp.]
MAMVEEVRRQFRTIPGIMEGTGKPEYDKCVAISTEASLKKMMLPGAIALLSPIIIGFIFGPEVLGGFLAGATVCGVLMGMFQNNAGGAWDNAKKSFEKGVDINGIMHYKKSEPHKASVTGDTVGDPFKDTSGPSMNILIKLMSIVSLVIAPTLAKIHHDKIEANRKAQIATMMKMDGMTEAVVAEKTITTTDTAGVTKTAVAVILPGKVNANGDFIYETGNPVTVPLPNDAQIILGENSGLYKLHEEIKANDDKLLDKNNWFTLEDLQFESGSAILKPESQVQLKNVYEILNCYNPLSVKLGGYTDNTGDEAGNIKLSLQRADAVKATLVKMGIAPDRLTTEGYGSQFEVADNNTTEGKARNRRIDVRVTKK